MKKIALQFSGGKDSLAMLLHARDRWEHLTVYHVDSGDQYPETQALVAQVEQAVPRFVRVYGDSLGARKDYGLPVDVAVPADLQGWSSAYPGRVRLQARENCCARAIMIPLARRMERDGVTEIWRGQRENDMPRNPLPDGAVVAGVTYRYPINNWSDAMVDECILKHEFPMPPFYAAGVSSTPDCMSCTAWLEHGAQDYLAANYPQTRKQVREALLKIRMAVAPAFHTLEKAL